MTRTRILVADACQFGFGVADGFVTTNDSIDRRFAFGLESRHACSRVGKFVSKPLGFEFSFGVLAGRAIAFAGQTLGLLAEPLERRFQLPRNLA